VSGTAAQDCVKLAVRIEAMERGVLGLNKTQVMRFVPFIYVGWHGKNIHVGHSYGGPMPRARSATKRPHPITLAHGSDSNIDRSQRCLALETLRGRKPDATSGLGGNFTVLGTLVANREQWYEGETAPREKKWVTR
jgi:hypothetical protein